MATIVAFKSTVLRNMLSDLSVSSFTVSFPSDDFPLIPCTVVADTNAGVVDLNSASTGLYNDPEVQVASFDIADFILKYADISAGVIALKVGGSWSATTTYPADRLTIATLINNYIV
jgi:hypothetical protein